MTKTGHFFNLLMKNLDRELSYFLFDDYQDNLATLVREKQPNFLSAPIRLINILDERGGDNS